MNCNSSEVLEARSKTHRFIKGAEVGDLGWRMIDLASKSKSSRLLL
jgi:hypothetical protein